jgi:hypothetical protein
MQPREAHSPTTRAPGALAIVLAAFLSFSVEPLVAKLLLPVFGGTAAVWLAALVFFQLALLGGYAWAHALARTGPRTQAAAHTALLLLSALFLPLHTLSGLTGLPPAPRVIALLIATAGLPYAALTATAPLVQSLWARTQRGSPYRLYALSNAASMIGLLAYPLLIEPWIGLHAQRLSWSVLYCVFALACIAAVWGAASGEPAPAPQAARPRALWIALPLCASALLSAVTGELTANVAPIPLLWVLPLAAYLLSFIVCFESDRLYRRWIFLPLAAAAAAWFAVRFGATVDEDRVALDVAISIACFLVLAIALHGELARRRPEPARLTGYFLLIALGGVLGGACIALAAPLLFRTLADLGVAVTAAALALAASFWREGGRYRRALRLSLALGVLFLGARFLQRDLWQRRAARFTARSFYGALRVQDERGVRLLVHGATEHGRQRFATPREPMGYYGRTSGVGLAIAALPGGPRRVGVIGLGAGVIAAYCRPGDDYAFFEIDSQVVEIARRWFSYLGDCKGARVLAGDGRLTLAANPGQRFDLLAVDAFSGDAVPTHLLTREAFKLYRDQLKPGGVLALHVSNLYLSLESVAAAAAWEDAWLVDDEARGDVLRSEWVLIGWHPPGAPRVAPGDAWTDDRSSVLAHLQ